MKITDFHSHILPFMDDGSKSVEESLDMLRLLKSQGVDRVVLTPHFYPNYEDPEQFLSKGRATPFAGWTVRGGNRMTIVDGRIVWQSSLIEK